MTMTGTAHRVRSSERVRSDVWKTPTHVTDKKNDVKTMKER